MKKILTFLTTGILMVMGVSAQAGIISVSSSVEQILNPAGIDLNIGEYESSANIRVIFEKQAYQLVSDLDVDDIGGNGNSGFNQNTTGTISANTLVNSYLIHFDRVGGGGSALDLIGTIEFDSTILGIIYKASNSSNSFTVSDDTNVLGLSGVTYSNNSDNFRGMELGMGGETPFGDSYFFASGGAATILNFTMSVTNSIDEIRVITAATAPVPVPAAVWLFGSALLGLVGVRRRKVS